VEVKRATPGAMIVGAGAPRLPNTSSIALPGAVAETLVIKLDLAGIAVSAGAACSSGKVGQSHVLTAMGLAPAIAGSAIRVSIGPETTDEDIATFVAQWRRIHGAASLAA
jgi:cysteine desulfurase